VPVASADLDEKRLEELKKKLKATAENVGGGVAVQHVIRLGRSWKEITDMAKEGNFDLVIVATHGYTGLKHALLGSVAEKIVRHAPCPVLVVRQEEHDFV